jgi:hypothetical protein
MIGKTSVVADDPRAPFGLDHMGQVVHDAQDGIGILDLQLRAALPPILPHFTDRSEDRAGKHTQGIDERLAGIVLLDDADHCDYKSCSHAHDVFLQKF